VTQVKTPINIPQQTDFTLEVAMSSEDISPENQSPIF
jgi:hypothetical protein